jgi:hypothetical protein
MKRLLFLALVICAFTLPALPLPTEAAPQAPDDCNLQFNGTDRKRVKLRTVADGASYFNVNGGDPLMYQDGLGRSVL